MKYDREISNFVRLLLEKAARVRPQSLEAVLQNLMKMFGPLNVVLTPDFINQMNEHLQKNTFSKKFLFDDEKWKRFITTPVGQNIADRSTIAAGGHLFSSTAKNEW